MSIHAAFLQLITPQPVVERYDVMIVSLMLILAGGNTRL